MRRATTALWAAAVALLFLVSTPRLAMAGPCADAAPLPGPPTALLGLEVRSGQFSHLRTGGSSTAPVDWSPTATQEPARVPSDVVGPTVVNVNYSGFSEEARTAFQFAVDVWKTHLSSPVPITIDASFEALGPTTLGGASPAVFVRESGSTTAPWYPVALANAVHGAILLPGTPDIVARFSDDANVWYFGTDGAPPPDRFDFVTVVLHELGHGFGMTGDFAYDATGTGSWGAGTGKGLPTIFDSFVANADGQVLVDDFPNNSLELGSQLISGALTFQGRAAIRAAGGRAPALFAPDVWMEGTSVYHLDPTSHAGLPDSLMTPSLRPGMAIHDPGPVVDGILRDVGWPPGLLALNPPISQPAATAATSTTTTAIPRLPVSRPAPRPAPVATTTSTRSTSPSTTASTTSTAPPRSSPSTTLAPFDGQGNISPLTTVPCPPTSGRGSEVAAPNRRIAAAPSRGGALQDALAFTGAGYPMWLLTIGLGLVVGGEATRRTTTGRAHAPSVTGPCG